MSSEANFDGLGTCPVPNQTPDRILLGHGSGGRLTGQLIERLLLPALRNPVLEALEDQAVLPIEGSHVAFTTDSFVVTPIFFPGGDIGQLAVHGTVNDLAVGGARPLALSLAFILEEGLPFEDLRRVVESAAAAAARVGVPIVTGDTKVVGRGSADGIFVNTSGIGLVPPGVMLGASQLRPGDAVSISGTIGDHGMAIMSQREGWGLEEASMSSDTAPLHELVAEVLRVCPEARAMRDPTRGGLAATLVETATRRGLGIEIREDAIPIRDDVRGACELLGLDPLLVANEGKLAVFVPGQAAEIVVDAMRAHPLGRDAAHIGRVTEDHPGLVVIETSVGGRRVLDLPFAEPLPRIC